jgi:hypothetical protein
MTSDRDSRDDIENEAVLKRLFDASATELSGPSLTKLRARAREVPERAPRAPRWLPRWAWSPLLGGLAVGAGALAVAIGVGIRGPESVSPGAMAGPDALVSEQRAPRAADPPMASSSAAPEADDFLDEDPFLEESAELAADFDLDVDQSYLDFDPIDDPADDDLDAWWEATADMVEGGG